MTNGTSTLVKAVLDCDVSAVAKCLSDGASPNETHGYPLITHAALLHNPLIFKLLLDFGASIPDNFFVEVISWELGDWIIQNESDEKELVKILDMLRSTAAWPSLDERRSLADRLEGYQLPRLIQALTDDTAKAEQE